MTTSIRSSVSYFSLYYFLDMEIQVVIQENEMAGRQEHTALTFELRLRLKHMLIFFH